MIGFGEADFYQHERERYLMSPFSPYNHIIFLYDNHGSTCILLLTAIGHLGICKVTLFTGAKTVSAFRTDPLCYKASRGEICLLTFVACFKLIDTPLFD